MKNAQREPMPDALRCHARPHAGVSVNKTG